MDDNRPGCGRHSQEWQMLAGIAIVEAAVTVKGVSLVLAFQWENSSARVCVRDSKTQKHKGSEKLNT